MGKYLKNNLAVWSHCLQTKNSYFARNCTPSWYSSNPIEGIGYCRYFKGYDGL